MTPLNQEGLQAAKRMFLKKETCDWPESLEYAIRAYLEHDDGKYIKAIKYLMIQNKMNPQDYEGFVDGLIKPVGDKIIF